MVLISPQQIYPLTCPEGVVLKTTDNVVPTQTAQGPQDDSDEDDEDVAVETREVEQLASFDEVVVWGHEAVPASDDAYSKGLGEWISFAEAVRFMLPYIRIEFLLTIFQMHSNPDEELGITELTKASSP